MKKKSITGIIVVALFIIGIIAALIVYKKMQMVPEKSQTIQDYKSISFQLFLRIKGRILPR